MGRPPIGETAMSNAERMRRYRAKHAPAKAPAKAAAKPRDADSAKLAREVARLRARIVTLENENAALRGTPKRQRRR
jgi:hypothetical protein